MPIEQKQLRLAANVRVVDANGDAPYSTIGAAVAAANDGDTILVMPGDYPESFTILKEITIVGWGAWALDNPSPPRVRINPTISATGWAINRDALATALSLVNLWIEPIWTGSTGSCYGFYNSGATVRMVDCYVGVQTSTGAGSATNIYGYYAVGGNLFAENCMFRNNDPSDLISTGTIQCVRESGSTAQSTTTLVGCHLRSGTNAPGNFEVDDVDPIIKLRGTVIDGTLVNTIGNAKIDIDVPGAIGTISGTTPNYKTPSALDVEDEGSLVGKFTRFNFAGAGVTVTDAGSGEATVSIPGGGGGAPASSIQQATDTQTTTSSTPVLIPGMTVTPASATYLVILSAMLANTQNNQAAQMSIYSGGTQVAASVRQTPSNTTQHLAQTTLARVTVNGAQAIEGRYNRVSAGTASIMERQLAIFQVS